MLRGTAVSPLKRGKMKETKVPEKTTRKSRFSTKKQSYVGRTKA